jgi:hypothetical protein
LIIAQVMAAQAMGSPKQNVSRKNSDVSGAESSVYVRERVKMQQITSLLFGAHTTNVSRKAPQHRKNQKQRLYVL